VSAALHGTEAFLARFDAAQDELPGNLDTRRAAAATLRASGLPGEKIRRRPEAWKYTDLRALIEARFNGAVAADDTATEFLARFPQLPAPRIVVRNGHISGTDPLPKHVRPLSQIARERLTPDRRNADPLETLNTMLATDGAVVHVPAGQDAGTIQMISVVTGDIDVHQRHHIRLDAEARLTLVEISAGTGSHFLNTVADIELGQGAELTHIRLQDSPLTAFQVSATHVDLSDNAQYLSLTVNLGSRLSRTETHALIHGSGANAHSDAIQLLTGRQHADFTSVVRHAAPNTTSRQVVKNVLADHSRGVFQGRIEVARDAQKVDGYQMNQALLLSDTAEVDTKPELEIFADDVKCSHGATVGQLDPEQLFYLQTRGIPGDQAREILVRAFIAEALETITDEAIRHWLDSIVEAHWMRR
jgi:Fe-S cluster assembly protein SufD